MTYLGVPMPAWDPARYALMAQITNRLNLNTDIFPEETP